MGGEDEVRCGCGRGGRGEVWVWGGEDEVRCGCGRGRTNVFNHHELCLPPTSPPSLEAMKLLFRLLGSMYILFKVLISRELSVTWINVLREEDKNDVHTHVYSC